MPYLKLMKVHCSWFDWPSNTSVQTDGITCPNWDSLLFPNENAYSSLVSICLAVDTKLLKLSFHKRDLYKYEFWLKSVVGFVCTPVLQLVFRWLDARYALTALESVASGDLQFATMYLDALVEGILLLFQFLIEQCCIPENEWIETNDALGFYQHAIMQHNIKVTTNVLASQKQPQVALIRWSNCTGKQCDVVIAVPERRNTPFLGRSLRRGRYASTRGRIGARDRSKGME